jgi:myo-inositol-1(or 4)-monophosphatase
MYSAWRGSGATLNGRRLHASGITELGAAMLAASFSPRVSANSPEVTRFIQVLQQCQTLRRLGSAALNLCYVAAGCLDGYWSTSVRAWDVAAGVLLVREAGGLVTSIDGGEFELERPDFIAASTEPLHRQLLAALELPAADRTVWLT